MEIYILDPSFKTKGIVDSFEELLWTIRYNAYGDFEIYTTVNQTLISLAAEGNYAWTKDTEQIMIVEETLIDTDIETGSRLIISGRSLESLLERRIIWKQTILTGNFQNGIQRLLNENIISPTDTSRRISNFIFEPSTDPAVTALTIDAQFTGDNLYEAIKVLCEAQSLGFKVTLNSDNQFVFKLYFGTDRSYAQNANPYVIFSPNFENIINSNYLETTKVMKNVALIAGEGEGTARKIATVGSASGLARRELFVDARDISSTIDGGTLTTAQYNAQLQQRGNEKLADAKFVQTFEGEVEASQMFVYGKDFFLGDIVQIVNEYGLEASSRVGEIIMSQNESGNNVVPSFTII